VEVDSGLVMLSGASTYTGTTTITGGTLVLDGVNRLFASSSLDLDGGTLETANGGGANAETLGCLELIASSTIDLDFSSMTFGCLSPVAAGAKLNVIDYDFFGSTHYAFRFAGDLTSNNSFQTLVANTLIDNGPALYSFDGTYTDVFAATPEPATITLLALGVAALFSIRRYHRASR
jgi:autotransporter-associated beta strand protein